MKCTSIDVLPLLHLLLISVIISGCSGPSQVDPVPRMHATIAARGADLHGANGIIFDKNDRLFIASAYGREIIVMDPDSGEIKSRFGPERGVRGPDDLAFSSGGALFWTEIVTGEVATFLHGGERSVIARLPIGVNPITFSADGRLFVALCWLGDALYEVDPAGNKEPRLIARNLGNGKSALNGMDWGPDNRLYGPCVHKKKWCGLMWIPGRSKRSSAVTAIQTR